MQPAAAKSAGVPRVVIVGGGFGGLYAARALARAPVRITLVDRHNYHLFQPLLYQVATAALNPSDIAAPIRKVLRRQRNAEVLLGEVRAVDVPRRRVVLDGGDELPYDHLVLATGATHSYFGHPEWSRHAPGLKTIEDALDIRRRVLLAYEAAERERDIERRRAWLTFVIVGAGPTGVELAGAFSEISRHALSGDFRHIDPGDARVILVEGAERVLPGFDEPLSSSALRQLKRIGVDVRLHGRVTAIDEAGVDVVRENGDERAAATERIEARTVIWAAGVAASPLARSLGAPLDRAGRVLVTPELSIPGHPEIAVIGDLAAVETDGRSVPGVAPAAIQAGRHAARNITRAIAGEPPLPFRYVDKGMLATIGRSAGVGAIGRLRLSGFLAWFAWLAIHIVFLIGFRNRFIVLFDWAWAYLTFDRGARLITGEGALPRMEPLPALPAPRPPDGEPPRPTA